MIITPTNLGKTLGQQHVVSVGNEMSESEGVPVDITRGEPLVGHVEVRQEVSLFHQGGHLFPLFRSGVHPCRVVSTGVEHDHRALGDVLDVLHGPGEVEATGGGVVVGVAAHIEAGKFKDWSVIAPGWLGKENGPVGRPMFGDELCPDPERSRSGDSLDCHVPAVCQNWTVGTKCELGSFLAEVGLTSDRSVLLVELGSDHVLLGLRRKL